MYIIWVWNSISFMPMAYPWSKNFFHLLMASFRLVQAKEPWNCQDRLIIETVPGLFHCGEASVSWWSIPEHQNSKFSSFYINLEFSGGRGR